MEPLTTSLTVIELVSGALGVAAIIGGVIMKVINSKVADVVEDVQELQESDADKEKRLRIVETKATEHDVHIGQLITTSERLLDKMDTLVGLMLGQQK